MSKSREEEEEEEDKKKKRWKTSSHASTLTDVNVLVKMMDLESDFVTVMRKVVQMENRQHADADAFLNVLEVCCTIPVFWQGLRDLQHVKMLMCVNRCLREFFEPKKDHLPYWGVWTQHLRYHAWKEISSFMDFKMNDKKHVYDVEMHVTENCRTQKRFSLSAVWTYMTTVRCKSPQEYAALICKYRKSQKVQRRRRETFAIKNGDSSIKSSGPTDRRTREGMHAFKIAMRVHGFDEVEWRTWSMLLLLQPPPPDQELTRDEELVWLCGARYIRRIYDIMEDSMLDMKKRRHKEWLLNSIHCQVHLMHRFVYAWTHCSGDGVDEMIRGMPRLVLDPCTLRMIRNSELYNIRPFKMLPIYVKMMAAAKNRIHHATHTGSL
jgi:hypothetical protein